VLRRAIKDEREIMPLVLSVELFLVGVGEVFLVPWEMVCPRVRQ